MIKFVPIELSDLPKHPRVMTYADITLDEKNKAALPIYKISMDVYAGDVALATIQRYAEKDGVLTTEQRIEEKYCVYMGDEDITIPLFLIERYPIDKNGEQIISMQEIKKDS